MKVSKTKLVLTSVLLIILAYLLMTWYFSSHYFFHTVVNGVDLSLKPYDTTESTIKEYLRDHKLILHERYGKTEVITAQAIQLQYNGGSNPAEKIVSNPFQWPFSLFNKQSYKVDDLFNYDREALKNEIEKLNCLTQDPVLPKNVGFKYVEKEFQLIKEVWGNKILPQKLSTAIQTSLIRGERNLDLDAWQCYSEPKYKINSAKTEKTRALLNKYINSTINYQFGAQIETLDRNITHTWLQVDENLDVLINKEEAAKYIRNLSNEYDTVGIERTFQTSVDKTIKINGGLYGWKIDREAETRAVVQDMITGKTITKNPIYKQKAFSRDGNEIGDTYVEINITRQHLWFYHNGQLLTQGPVVTGNPNQNNGTVTGVYFVNYKQKDATLKGANYVSPVSYWMPFFGNQGLHDASWRYSFGGQIYKSNGSHGCVNAPYYLAKTIFEHVKEGTPIITYHE